MSPDEIEGLVRSWLASERIEIREQEDERAKLHLLVKYPQGKNGHMFAIIIPKGRKIRRTLKETNMSKRRFIGGVKVG